jgi:hypothetical protein
VIPALRFPSFRPDVTTSVVKNVWDVLKICLVAILIPRMDDHFQHLLIKGGLLENAPLLDDFLIKTIKTFVYIGFLSIATFEDTGGAYAATSR